ncbi:hypothetical protein [Variovorax sp. N23]|jgi:hypothetical protein|uniref:hypothetical protein n=1 Tax=Variovorax sp. N23 TaxID=2980555 RepID=UPI0021CA44E8|nr:hypothetical protein [Variovorax sp. N23]MCU4119566.1 hypothetical protein [Variovorax sp. N23]
MSFSFVRCPALASALALSSLTLLGACTTPPPAPAPPPTPAPMPAPPPPAVRVTPVEAEPIALATQPALAFALRGASPADAVLTYADRLRSLGANELTAELARLGEPGDTPLVQMQVALVLAQTRVPADLARSLGLLQRVISNPSADARPLQPLARLLAARFLEQRKVEDDRDRQAQQARDAQRRIDQLNDRIEALRAIERSFARPNAPAPAHGGKP